MTDPAPSRIEIPTKIDLRTLVMIVLVAAVGWLLYQRNQPPQPGPLPGPAPVVVTVPPAEAVQMAAILQVLASVTEVVPAEGQSGIRTGSDLWQVWSYSSEFCNPTPSAEAIAWAAAAEKRLEIATGEAGSQTPVSLTPATRAAAVVELRKLAAELGG